jgi:CO/xanthine dehydrogenase FAD-binding subunit
VTVKLGRDGRCESATIAPLSAPAPVRASAAEQQLRGTTLDDASIRAASAEAVRDCVRPRPSRSTEYRIGLLRTMTERALTKATQRAEQHLMSRNHHRINGPRLGASEPRPLLADFIRDNAA